MTTVPELSVVIAVHHAQDNLPTIMQRLKPSEHPGVEFLVCSTQDNPATRDLVPNGANVKLIDSAPRSLIPHLWRDGILAATGERVATTTAHCVPEPDWLEHILSPEMGDEVGIGGVIDNDPASDKSGWAIFFLRYISYAPPQTAREVREIAADNAVYRREDLIRHSELLQEGFWEPEFHERVRGEGLTLFLDPKLKFSHRNRYKSGEFIQQRMSHGEQFGWQRTRRLGPKGTLLYLICSPILPFVFLAKILRTVYRQRKYRRYLPGALAWLMVYLTAWGIGEAKGYLHGLRGTDTR